MGNNETARTIVLSVGTSLGPRFDGSRGSGQEVVRLSTMLPLPTGHAARCAIDLLALQLFAGEVSTYYHAVRGCIDGAVTNPELISETYCAFPARAGTVGWIAKRIAR